MNINPASGLWDIVAVNVKYLFLNYVQTKSGDGTVHTHWYTIYPPQTHDSTVPYQVEGSTVAGAAIWQITMAQQQSSMCNPGGRWMQTSLSVQKQQQEHISRDGLIRFDLLPQYEVTERHPPYLAGPRPVRWMFWSRLDSSGPEWWWGWWLQLLLPGNRCTF